MQLLSGHELEIKDFMAFTEHVRHE